jgi:hypothetical protein
VHTNANPARYADTHGNGNGNSNCYSYSDTYGYTNSDGYTQANAHCASPRNATTTPHPAAATGCAASETNRDK